MRIGVLRETQAGERRVALTPDVAKRLIQAGHSVVVEMTAGLGAGLRDADYEVQGATVAKRDEVLSTDLIAAVNAPRDETLGERMVLGLLRPLEEPQLMAAYADRGVTALAFELVPRTTRAQAMDALSSQATVSGYQGALEAAAACDRFFPMLTTAAGTIRPARALVLGAGVAGLQAIATCRRLGAVVSGFDIRAAAAEQVRSLGAAFIEVDMEPQDAASNGGYARQLETDAAERVLASLSGPVAGADAVIATAAIPGKPAPLLITAAMVEAMRPGSVIVDIAAATGGNCELTKPGEATEHNGVHILGFLDLPSRKPFDASQMYARNVAALLEIVGADGTIDLADDILDQVTVTHRGEVRHARIRELATGG
ncbi:MAG TPA: NAD(P) transhydrogenase subunit alpha [Acidimicrobiia bacterium]|jgi:NAD(P) transhydrogenase subunit alpha|nr:NAD(P) transhydrogenase subunit alpha [Acidimicrobiia bacterium]